MPYFYRLTILLLFVSSALNAQKMLLLEKRRSTEPTKFYIGQVLNYRLSSDGIWRTGTIMDLDFKNQEIQFSNANNVHISDVNALRFYQIRQTGKAISNSLWYFGGGWGLFSAGDELVTGNNDWELTGGVMATSAALGGIVWLATRQRTKRIGKRKRLRVTDLNL